ncbi:MAG: citramalate synthase [Planctomycetota bacterium]
MPRIQIYDTTLRDGSQGEGVNFSLQDKLLITRRLDELGVDYIEGGYPLSNPKDVEYFQEVRKLPLKHAKICAFGMTRRKNCDPKDDVCLKALVDAQTPVITIVGKTWDLHVREVIGATLEENLAMIRDSVAWCKSQGREIIYDAEHFFDGSKANFEYALQTLKAAWQAGASVLALCDTNGGTQFEDIGSIIDRVRKALPEAVLGIHCHNDCELAVANSLTAVSHGCQQVQGTINGIGERCGNVDLISVVANLTIKRGYEALTADCLPQLTAVSRFVYEMANTNLRNGQAFVGSSAFAHKGGMHAHGVAKLSSSYEHIDPALVGNQRRILISELSGQSNILAKTAKYAIANDKNLLIAIRNKVEERENEGYEFEAAEASFDLLVKQTMGVYERKFERLGYHVNVEIDESGRIWTEATVKVSIHGEIEHHVAEGHGPIDALNRALRKALKKAYPQLDAMELVDYKVRVVNSKAATAARVRVVIESRDKDNVWGTVGVSENIIEASWLALVDSFEYKLFKDDEKPG